MRAAEEAALQLEAAPACDGSLPAPTHPAAEQPGGGAEQPQGCPAAASAGATSTHAPAAAALAAKDVDADALAVRLDRHARALRQDLLAYFLELKESQAAQRRAAVEAQAAEDAAALATKQGELDGVLAQLAAQKGRARRLTAALERAVYRLHKRNRLRKSWQLLARAWHAWRDHTARMRRLERAGAEAARRYDVGKLQAGVLRAWRGWAHGAYRERLKAAHEAGLEAARQHIWQEANTTNHELTQRVAALEEELAAERSARAKLEEDMKRAFMRGVCALNIEAMALMKNGALPGGPSPAGELGSQQQEAVGLGGEAPAMGGTLPAGGAAVAPAEPWLIGSLAAGQQAQQPLMAGAVVAAVAQPVAVTQQQWTAPPSAKASVPQGVLPLPRPSPALPGQWQHHHQQQQQPAATPGARPGAAGAATLVVLPRPAAQVPHPIIKVAPAHPLDVVFTPHEGPLAVCSPATHHTRPSAPVPSNLPNNVPDHVAAAVAARPQTAAGAARASAVTAAPPRRPATATAGRAGKHGGGVSQRSLAAKKGPSGPVVIRGAQQGGEAARQRVTAQEAAEAQRSMHKSSGR